MGFSPQTGAKTALRSAPVSHRHDESQPAIPGGLLSSMARFRFTGQAQTAVPCSCRSSILQRTANSVLFRCLSRGVHSKGPHRILRDLASGSAKYTLQVEM